MTHLPKIFRDPLIHFVFIALGLFVFDGVFNAEDDAQYLIEVDQQRIDWIKQTHLQEFTRLPTEQQLQALIEQYVQDEVLFREALAMELEQDDIIVRRRLLEKMRFLTQDAASTLMPSEQVLLTFYQDNPQLFLQPARFSFSHFYFNSQRQDAKNDALEALARLNHGSETPQKVGDPFMLKYQYQEQSQGQILRSFGQEFIQHLEELPLDQWSGPVPSVYGWHVVKVQHKTAAAVGSFAAMKGQVLDSWLAQQRERINEKVYGQLRQRYRVSIHNGLDG